MSAAGKKDAKAAATTTTACLEFTQHAWKPEVCVNCHRPRSAHSATVPSKATLSAKIVLGKTDPVTNANDPSVSSSSSSQGPIPNKRSATLPRQIKIAKPRTDPGVGCDADSKENDSKTLNRSDKGGDSASGGVSVSGAEDNQRFTEVNGNDDAKSQSKSYEYKRSKNVARQGSDSSLKEKKKSSHSQTEGKKSNNDAPKGILSRKRSKSGDRKKSEERPNSRVAFIDSTPDVIGYDGGFNNVFEDDDAADDNDDEILSSSSEGNFSLTDEEKSFALLSLENTVWNSESENLLRDKDAGASQPNVRSSREFEDVHSDALGVPVPRFQSLRDCDATQRFKFHTFPLRKRSSSGAKLALESVFTDSGIASGELSTREESMKDLANFSENCKTSRRNSGKGRVEVDDLSNDSSNAYKVVNIVDDVPRSSSARLVESDISVSENSGSSSGKGHASSSESNDSPVKVKGRGRPRPQAIRVSTFESPRPSPQDGSGGEEKDEDEGGDFLNDSTTAAGLQVLALLNDVLDNYGDNESSTDDPRDEKGGGKKEFEARMASVAANLDLSKQRSAKRPAPRPPSSPPPEPAAVQSPKRKTHNQPDPVFKMVPVGRAIMSPPPSQDPKSSPSSNQGFPSFDDMGDGEGGEKVNGDANRKKGITSFFKNILRRGKDSEGSFESSNPEVHFAVRSLEVSSSPSLTEKSDGGSKVRVLPQGSSKGGSASTGDLPKKAAESEGGGGSGGSSGDGVVRVAHSPPTQPKNKGLPSPKEMLKRTAAKLSPPTQRKDSKPPLTSKLSSDDKDDEKTSSQPQPVRRRAKSPKRTAPPVPPPPSRQKKEEESLSADLTRELEQRLRSSSIGSTTSATTPVTPVNPGPSVAAKPSVKAEAAPPQPSRTESRKSMTVPPPSPPTNKPTLPYAVSRSPPTSPTQEESDSQTGSPDDTMSNSDESPRFSEKIELPTAAPGKKGILGKLNMNRKARAPAPPGLVKRAQSVGDREKKGKKINPADISGPVVLREGPKSAERRNTISLGEEDSTSNSVTNQHFDKGFDDMDMPIISPLGSLENLYEAILPKDRDGGMFPYYDQTDKSKNSGKALCPNVPAEGYLEPVTQATATIATEGDQEGSGGSVTSSSSSSKVTDVKGAIATDDGQKGVKVEKKPTTAKKPIVAKLPSKSSSHSSSSSHSAGQGKHFVEPEMTEERRQLLANQPIYEEIPANGPEDTWEEREVRDDLDFDTKSLTSQITQMTDVSSSPARTAEFLHKPTPIQSATLPHPKRKPVEVTGSKVRRRGSASTSDNLQSSVPPSVTHHHHQVMTSSMTSALSNTNTSPSPFMTASMTSSFVWQNVPSSSQPVDSNGELLPLPPIPAMAPRSISKETVVSSESESSGGGGSGTRPRPIPRRQRPKRPETVGSDQYVSMNRPNVLVTLGESKLRETFSRLTTLNFQTLHDVYVQCEKLLTLERMTLGAQGQHLKWADFDIYGQALHATGRCVVYNSKLRASNTPCQIMVLHSRPAAEMSLSAHPSLLRPAAIFADNVPFSFLTAEFIKTSQLLQNSVYDSNQARCFLAVGLFDIADSLSAHLALLRETLTHDLGGYLQVLMMTLLQLLSAFSHCLDRGFTVTETDLGDVFHITRQDLRGKVVALLPHQRAPDVPQGEAMCGFLDKLLQDATNAFYTPTADIDSNPDPALDDEGDTDKRNLLTTVERLRILLEPRRIECLAQLRAVVEYTLWGPTTLDDGSGEDNSSGGDESASIEQDHSAWLERERGGMVAKFACSTEGLGSGVGLEDFYRLKFLLKSSATSLSECWRRLN